MDAGQGLRGVGACDTDDGQILDYLEGRSAK